jgi:hypothetical protein
MHLIRGRTAAASLAMLGVVAALGFMLLTPAAAFAQDDGNGNDESAEEADDAEDETPAPAEECKPGTFSSTGLAPCTTAAPGKFAAGLKATAQVDCPPGTYQPDAGKTSCIPAPAGTFVAATGAIAATPCAAGTFNAATGSTASTACTPVPAGSFSAAGAASGTLCAAGTFSANSGSASCTPAPAGRFVATTGAKEPTPCPVGTFQPATGQTSCIPAPAGSFVPTTGSNAAALCRPGTYMGSTGASQCTTASRGYYVPQPGATRQLACASSTTTGATTCEPTAAPAPADDDDLDGGVSLRADGEPCPPGSWSETGTVPSGGTCIPARPGSFVAMAGSTAEVECPAGTFSDSFGSDACVPAPAGTYVPVAGSAEPLPCEGSTILGATECGEVALATPASLEDGPARAGMGASGWLLILGAVLGAGVGTLFLLERRRPGFLAALLGSSASKDAGGRASRPMPGEPAPPVPPQAAATEVLEWDELLDDPDDL